MLCVPATRFAQSSSAPPIPIWSGEGSVPAGQGPGRQLGRLQTKLLAKVEELTLQMIQLDEKNRALAKKVAQLEGR